MLGKIEGLRRGDDRGWDGWMASLIQGDMSLSKLREMVKDREAGQAAVHGVTERWTRLSDWTPTKEAPISSSVSTWKPEVSGSAFRFFVLKRGKGVACHLTRFSPSFFTAYKVTPAGTQPTPMSRGLHAWLGGYHGQHLPKTLLQTKHSLVSHLTPITASLSRKLAQGGCGLLKVTQLLNHKDTALNLSSGSCATADTHLSSWQDKPLFFFLLQKHSL